VIPEILNQALSPHSAQVVVADGAIQRDFVHVDDVARAILAAVAHDPPGNVYNVGSGQSCSILEIAHLITGLVDSGKPVIDRAGRRPNDILRTRADISAITRDLGWTPEITMAEGMAGLVRSRTATAAI